MLHGMEQVLSLMFEDISKIQIVKVSNLSFTICSLIIVHTTNDVSHDNLYLSNVNY